MRVSVGTLRRIVKEEALCLHEDRGSGLVKFVAAVTAQLRSTLDNAIKVKRDSDFEGEHIVLSAKGGITVTYVVMIDDSGDVVGKQFGIISVGDANVEDDEPVGSFAPTERGIAFAVKKIHADFMDRLMKLKD
jgi:hypothetical protein